LQLHHRVFLWFFRRVYVTCIICRFKLIFFSLRVHQSRWGSTTGRIGTRASQTWEAESQCSWRKNWIKVPRILGLVNKLFPPCMLLTPPLGEEQFQFPVPLPSVPVGGRLTQFLHHWEKFTTDVWVLSVIGGGLDLVFQERPPLSDSSIPMQNREIYHRSHSPSFLGNQEETRIKPWCRLSQRNFLYYSFQ
jgi:hypothetical protein